MTLEQFVTKAKLLVDEAGYPSRYTDRMVPDTVIAGISNDVVRRKIIKKGHDTTLVQVLEISKLETATQQLLSQMSNTKLSVNYVSDNKKRTIKVENIVLNNKVWENSMDLDLSLQVANQMLVENSRLRVKSVIDLGKADINQMRSVVPSVQSVTNMERKAIME